MARKSLNKKETPLLFTEESLSRKERKFSTVPTNVKKSKEFHALTAAICKHYSNLTLIQTNVPTAENRAHSAVNLFPKI